MSLLTDRLLPARSAGISRQPPSRHRPVRHQPTQNPRTWGPRLRLFQRRSGPGFADGQDLRCFLQHLPRRHLHHARRPLHEGVVRPEEAKAEPNRVESVAGNDRSYHGAETFRPRRPGGREVSSRRRRKPAPAGPDNVCQVRAAEVCNYHVRTALGSKQRWEVTES